LKGSHQQSEKETVMNLNGPLLTMRQAPLVMIVICLAIFFMMWSIRPAPATEFFVMNCKGLLVQVWGRHGYEFNVWDENEQIQTGSDLPSRWFRKRRLDICTDKGCDNSWTLLGHKCKYVKNLMPQ
jgi:hypothetical protein